jgi:hypothetical protein
MKLSRKAMLLAPALALGLTPAVFADGWFRWFKSDEQTTPGSRQKQYAGKSWPPEARPCGPCEPFVHQYHTAHYWPDPYRWQDRSTVRTILATQVGNGWTAATTLYEQHFDPETNQLNEAGRLQLRWILLHTPVDRRMAWVAAGNSEAITQTRLSNAQAEALAIGGPGCAPIMIRVCQTYGRSANDVDLINRNYLETVPQPRLPIPLTGGGSGNSGSGGGGEGAGS